MNTIEFIKNFEEQLEDHDGTPLTLETEFRSLECWDSLTGSAVQLMISDEYNSDIPDVDFKNCKTISDLYDLTIKYRK